MAWIESHQDLGRSPKVRRLARKLGISLPTVIGHMHLLWWWALDFAQEGDLAKYELEDIADAMCFDGEPKLLIEALEDARFVDFVEETQSYHIHNWHRYAGKLLDIRKKDAERKRNSRRKKGEVSDASDGQLSDGVRNSNSNIDSNINRTVTENINDTNTTTAHDHVETSNALIKLQDEYCSLHQKTPKQLRQSDYKSMKIMIELIPDIDFIIGSMKLQHDGKRRREEAEGIGFRPPSTFKYYEGGIKDAWVAHLAKQERSTVVPLSTGRRWGAKPNIPVIQPGAAERLSDEELQKAREMAAKLDQRFNKVGIGGQG